MPLNITVARNATAWAVYQDCQRIQLAGSKPAAVEVGQLLAFAAKATGFDVSLRVLNDAGELETWDPDGALERLARAAA